MSDLDSITQAARETLERHAFYDDAMRLADDGERGEPYKVCLGCYENWPCPDRLAAERIVHAAGALAATHEKIRELCTPDDLDVTVPCGLGRKHVWKGTWQEAVEVCDWCGLNREPQPYELEAILGLLSEKPTEPEETT